MSYDKIIGFGINPDKPKGPLRPLNSQELEIFHRFGVKPIYHDLKTRLPSNNRENEGKILVPGPRGLRTIRESFIAAQNAFLIPGQVYIEKDPLTSILLDSVEDDQFPSAKLDEGHHTLRYRLESDPETGVFQQGDYNEKSAMAHSGIIGGMTDRVERELEQRPGEELEHAFQAFLNKYRRRHDPAYTDRMGIQYRHLRVPGGYQAARNELGVCLKHPIDPALFVFEGCEDFWHVNQYDMSVIPFAKFFEKELEPRQVWGQLPDWVNTSPQAFQYYVNSTMHGLVTHLQRITPGAFINTKSKGEFTKEHIESTLGFSSIKELGLTEAFTQWAQSGRTDDISAFQYSLTIGQSLEQTLINAHREIHNNGARLHSEKNRYNAETAGADIENIGEGNYQIYFDNDNYQPVTEDRGLRIN